MILSVFIGTIGLAMYELSINSHLVLNENVNQTIANVLTYEIIGNLGLYFIAIWFISLILIKFLFEIGRLWNRSKLIITPSGLSIVMNWIFVAIPIIQLVRDGQLVFAEKGGLFLSFIPLISITIFFIKSLSPNKFKYIEKVDHLGKLRHLKKISRII